MRIGKCLFRYGPLQRSAESGFRFGEPVFRSHVARTTIGFITQTKSMKNASKVAVIGVRNAAQPLSTNKHLLRWVEKMAELTEPAAIHWVNGSKEEYDELCAQMVKSGTFVKLNEKLWPGCYYARSDANDVARVEDRTFICSLSKDNAGPMNNWEDPFEMRRKLKGLFSGAMQGRPRDVL